MKTLIRKSHFINIIVAFIYLILILNIISINSDSFFNLIGFRTYTVLSGSMEPELYPGDIVVIISKNRVNLNKNDIVTFKKDDMIITHRIVGLDTNGYITKGDNNRFTDSAILKNEDIIGKVLFNIPKIGYVLKFLSKPTIISLEMIILGALILLKLKK